MTASQQAILTSGIAIIHANQLETLVSVVEHWLLNHPLMPLEKEVFLVHNSGMGQWLKQNLASNDSLGIAAAFDIKLPSLFIWQVYRAVLGQPIAKEQPLAKSLLVWRFYRLLPQLKNQQDFEHLAHFFADDKNSRKLFQLAEQLADLFDQYQVYRSDWLTDWANDLDQLRQANGTIQSLTPSQRWQAILWRKVLKEMSAQDAQFASRASVHSLFLEKIDQLKEPPTLLPRRVILFGLSTIPQQTLEVLAKIGKFCQIILFVQNPCQHYWADIIEDKELLKAERRRHDYKPGMTKHLSNEELHLHANPLLAAWGKQGRDYIRLLDVFDEPQLYDKWHWPENKIDLFQDYGSAEHRSLLQIMQQSILDLQAIPDQPVTLSAIDDSIIFHIAHSPQREVEILHDQLLARFNSTEQTGHTLHPRDVIVMVPDINQYAPHIRAVFGQIKNDDLRYIPFSIADQQQRGVNPLLVALETLLKLPESRFTVSEFLGLLEVPALRNRYDIAEAAIPKLHQWIEESGIRWGFNSQQRQTSVAMPAHLNSNTWHFGLQRMLLGFASGTGEAFNGIEPYEEMGGLDAEWLGSLVLLLENLEIYSQRLKQSLCTIDWQPLLAELLTDFFAISHEDERKTIDTLTHTLQKWQQNCDLAGLTTEHLLPINVVREVWLTSQDAPNLQQRFLGGRVNFCTLMPMRAIPFRLVCVLGMNDGDYPRNQPAQSFDLMSQRGHYRPGDRSRRQDDQYLFLEALLSARQQFYVSWVGRSIRDNSDRPPSVLVSQLRDALSQYCCLASKEPTLLQAITIEHPLQPFSIEYLKTQRSRHLFTYTQEWFASPTSTEHLVSDDNLVTQTVSNEPLTLTVNLETLARFLRAPVKTFCTQTLHFVFDNDINASENDEPFGFDYLQEYIFKSDLLKLLIAKKPQSNEQLNHLFQQHFIKIQRQGKLPLGGFAKLAFDTVTLPVQATWQHYQNALEEFSPAAPKTIELEFDIDNIKVQLTGNLPDLHTDSKNTHRLITLLTSPLLTKTNKINYHQLMPAWLQHLVLCATDRPLNSLIIGPDKTLKIKSLAKTEAQNTLQEIIQGWYLGLQTPLPIEIKSAFVWWHTQNLEDAQNTYEGTDQTDGVIAFDYYQNRFYPSFRSMRPFDDQRDPKKNDFKRWSEQLYMQAHRCIELPKKP